MLLVNIMTMVLLMRKGHGAFVEIEDYWGDVQFQEGVPQNITCTVEDPQESGIITWKVGDRLLDPKQCSEGGDCLGLFTDSLEYEDENLIQQTIAFIPSFEDDSKRIICEYLVEGEEPQSDSIGIVIYQQLVKVLQQQPVRQGDPATIQVTAILYPSPIEEDFTWRVESGDGNTSIVDLYPGERDEYGRYEAGTIQKLGDHNYFMKFTIPAMSETEAEYRHSLVIDMMELPTKVLYLNIPFIKGSEAVPDERTSHHSATPEKEGPHPSTLEKSEKSDDPKGHGKSQISEDTELSENSQKSDDLEGSENSLKSEDPKGPETPGVAMAGLGLAIIIGLFFLCLVLCIIFCCVRKRKKQQVQKSTYDGKGAFTIVGSGDPQAHHV